MKKTYRLLPFLMAALLLLTACSANDSSAPGGTGKKYVVGICQLDQHAALDDATRGFMDALNEALPGQVEFNNQNAGNELTNCATIINQFVASEVDLILANATPALQTAAAATVDIPILGTSVTEYGAALGIDEFSGTVGGNVSGTSDFAPLDKQAEMVKAWFPDAKQVGLLYCSSEANSRYQIDLISAALGELGYTCREYPFTDSNDLSSVAEAAAAGCDVLYVPTDNTVAANVMLIGNICRAEKIPVIGGDRAICESCSVAALSVSYYDLGVTTGKMAAKILSGEANVSEMPIAYAAYSSIYNTVLCEELGLTPPEGYTGIGGQ